MNIETMVFIIVTNVATYVLARHFAWQELKETSLLPFQVAILNGKCKNININAEVEDSFQPQFDVLMRAMQRYHAKRGKKFMGPSDSGD